MGLNIKDNIFYWSEAFLKVFGMPKDTVAGFEAWTKALHPDDMQIASNRTSEAVKNKTKLNSKYRIILPNKEIRWILATGEVFCENDIAVRMIGLCTDITETEKIVELNKKILQCTTDWIWEVDLEGKYVYCSENVKNILGYSPNEIIGKTPFNFMSVEESKNVRATFEKIFKKQEPIVDLENWNIHKNGTKVCLLTNGFPIFEENGLLKGYSGADKEITKRKEIQEDLQKREIELKQQNTLFSTLINNLQTGIFMVEAPTGKPLIANNAALKLLGRGILPDTNQKNLSEVYKAYKFGTKTPYPTNEMPIIMGMEGKPSYIDDMIVERPDGTHTLLEVYGSPVKNDDGTTWASIVSFNDVSEKKKVEEELKQSKEVLQLKLNELEIFHKIAVDRELKMIELKEKIKELEKQINKNSMN